MVHALGNHIGQPAVLHGHILDDGQFCQLLRRGIHNLQFVLVRDVAMQNSGLAYMIAKRVNHLQAQRAAATTWRERRARINTISPGIIVTPLAYDEFNANGDGYQAMIDASAAQRVATSDEIADAASFLLGEHATFINGTDLLIDGGVIPSIRTGMFKLQG